MMPLQNRVDPWGRLHAHQSKAATRMGNRGILHDDNNKIVRPWAHKGWVSCLTSFKEIKRPQPFSKGNYSELFFLDEATAFSAGHRPCSYCQRDRSKAFREAWLRANVAEPEIFDTWRMPQIDRILHAERAMRGGAKVSYEASIGELSVGSMFEHAGSAFLLSPHGILPWSFDGYGAAQVLDQQALVRVLKPRSIVGAFAAGFVPSMHGSAAP